MERTITVLDYDLPLVKERVAKLAKKAQKLGLTVPTLKVGTPYEKTIEVPRTGEDGRPYAKKIKVIVVDVELVGDMPKVPGGWEFIARLDIRDEMAIIRATPAAEEIPAEYRGKNDGHCDHCRVIRKRADVFVLKNAEDKYVQVGRQCLKDYLGETAEKILAISRFYAKLDDEAREWLGFAPRVKIEEIIFPAKEVLTAASAIIRKFGWVGTKQATEAAEAGEYKTPTKADVFTYLVDDGKAGANLRKLVAIDDKDKEFARRAIEWIKGLDVNKSEFNYNMRAALLDSDAVRVKNFGFIVYAVEAIRREDKKTAERIKFVDEYIGKIGTRQEFKAKLLGVNHVDGYYGGVSIHRFVDEKGRVIVWFASRDEGLEKDEWYTFAARIKDHRPYKEYKQTIVTRLTLK